MSRKNENKFTTYFQTVFAKRMIKNVLLVYDYLKPPNTVYSLYITPYTRVPKIKIHCIMYSRRKISERFSSVIFNTRYICILVYDILNILRHVSVVYNFP